MRKNTRIVLIELLISDCFDRKMSFPLTARGMVDDVEGADDLAAAIKLKQKATEVDVLMDAVLSFEPDPKHLDSTDGLPAYEMYIRHKGVDTHDAAL